MPFVNLKLDGNCFGPLILYTMGHLICTSYLKLPPPLVRKGKIYHVLYK